MSKNTSPLLNPLFLMLLISIVPITASQPEQQTKLRVHLTLQLIQDKAITMLSGVINFLKRILVLATLLFLIENLINFWVLASSYAFLDIEMPTHFKDTITNIYTLYN